MKKELSWRGIAARIAACRLCPGMNLPATQSAPAWGPPSARFLFVGQSLHGIFLAKPLLQVPFLSPSGVPLSEVFVEMGWPPIAPGSPLPSSPYILTNLVHCHPPANRPSKPAEIESCSRHLQAELEFLAARNLAAVISIGSAARDELSARYARGISPKRDKLARLFVKGKPLWFLHLTHPAAALRGGPVAVKMWKKEAAAALASVEKLVATGS